MEKFNLEKNVWTGSDFDLMGWHDSTVYGMAVKKGDDTRSNEILFDIDYIFKWIHPEVPGGSFSFWIAPCTLIFKQVFDLKINIHAGDWSVFELEIEDIHKVAEKKSINSKPQWEWYIELQQGHIRFEAEGYEQIVKREAIYLGVQQIPPGQRGEINFGLIPYRGL